MNKLSSPEWRELERYLKKVGHGCVFDLPIEHGMPRVDPELRYRKSEMLKPCNSSRTGPKEGDGLRDARFENLIRICETRGDVVITILEVHDGLPHRIETEGAIHLL
jgi:hypothetical protein